MAMAAAEGIRPSTAIAKKQGTLVVVVMKAKNLPNRQKIGKQDPYCVVRLSHIAERTKTDKRGGQSPFWDHEMRFPIPFLTANSTSDYTTAKVTVFSDDSKDPMLIGDASIDLKSVYKDGEFDEWVELSCKGRYAGEVYLEMTYYSEAPPPIPALPKEVVSRGLHSRDSSYNGSPGGRLKRRPLPQQPEMLGDSTPPPPRTGYRHPYEQLPPSTSHGPRPSTSMTHFSRPSTGMSYQQTSRPSTGVSMHNARPSSGVSMYSTRPSTGISMHSARPSTSVPQDYYPDDYAQDRPRQRSLGYDRPQSQYEPPYGTAEYSYNHPPDSPTLGRHRSEASLRTQYYEIRPLGEVEQQHYPPPPSRTRPRSSLPLPQHMSTPPYNYDRPRPAPIENFDLKYRNALNRDSLDDYYQTPPHPPPEDPYPQDPYPQDPYPQDPYQQDPHQPPPQEYVFEEPEEIIPVHPYISPSRKPAAQVITHTPPPFHSPHHSPHVTPHSSPPKRQSYSPHTPQRSYSPEPHYSPTPPPHRASSRSPTPLKKPTPVRAIDHLPPSSFAPEHTPPSARRALPTPPGVNSSPSVYSQSSSPLVQRGPQVPAKIPLGMTEAEYWAVAREEERIAYEESGSPARFRGLVDDGGGWREVKSALNEVERGYRRY